MSADEDLERSLRAMLRRRSDRIDSAPLIEFGDAPAPTTGRWRPMILGASVAAAVVAVLVATSVVFTRRDTEPQHSVPGSSSSRSSDSSGPTPPRVRPTSPQKLPKSPPISLGATTCTASPSGLSALLARHRQSVDQPMNSPLATAPGGAFIMQQQRMNSAGVYGHNELAYFGAGGHGTTMWTDNNPDKDHGDYNVAVDPNAAASKDWVVFSPSVVNPAGSTHLVNTIKAWNVHTHQLLTLAHQNDAAGLGLSPFAPIVVGDIAYWIEYPTANTHRQLLIGWNLATRRLASSQHVADAVELLRLGGQVAMVVEGSSGPVRIVAGPGGSIPAAFARASIGLIDNRVDVSSDGTLVRWAVASGSTAVQVRTWLVGSATVSSVTITAAGPAVPTVFAGSLIVFGGGPSRVVDVSTGRVTTLPDNTYIDLAAGGDVIMTTQTSSRSNSISRVPLAQLTALLCR